MDKQAVIIYGPPGSGKGTQAELLAKLYGFVHFDTGRYVERLVHSKKAARNKILARERELFDSGKLMTPSFILKIVSEATEKIAKTGANIVYSGSPRTLYEASGESNNGLLKILKKYYGLKSVLIIKLNLKEITSIRRNSHRLICSVCGLPALAQSKVKNCSFCAAPMRKRTLDKPAVIKVRLVEYRNRTYPILKLMKKLGFRIKEINGEPPPHKVFSSITKTLRIK